MNPMIMVPDSTGIDILPDNTGYRYVPDTGYILLNLIPKSWPDIRFYRISGTSLLMTLIEPQQPEGVFGAIKI